jgi:fucose 4-O-acetylase-like acetyltransferase
VLVVLVGYALLSAYWKPIAAATGWFFIPLGQATLYVFIMHVFFVLIISNVPFLREGSVWLNSLAYVVVLALMWTMVKTRFLFTVVPR